MGYQKPLYLTTKRGVYYYTRRVPQSLKTRFKSPRFVKCLHTRSDSKASSLSQELSSRLENIWDRMRLEVLDFRSAGQKSVFMGVEGVRAQTIFRISDAFELYLRLKAHQKPNSFKIYTDRNKRYLLECLGDEQVEDLSPLDGAKFRDHLLSKALSSSSIRRIFSTIKSVINLSISEQGLLIENPFSKVFIPEDGMGKKRKPIPAGVISTIQAACQRLDDDQRWLIALISDTGMRLSEACGLLIEDIKLDTNIPYVNIKPHKWRRLKTVGSERKVPLVGTSLWAAKRLHDRERNGCAFPRYCSAEKVKANSASGALNKWLSNHAPVGCVIHSFRHSFRDRLRAVECHSDLIDELGGWKSGGVGNTYGSGYTLEIKSRWLKLIALST